MGEGGRAIAIAGANRPLGRRVAETLREAPWVARVVGIESDASSEWMDGVQFVANESEPRQLVALFQEFAIDTVIHCAFAADRSGTSSEPSGGDVIQTLRLAAAITDPKTSVRSFVVASSSDVYPVSTHAPLVYPEGAEEVGDDGSVAATLVEAERYARDVAERALHIDVALLRLAPVVGRGFSTPFGRLLAQRPLPVPLGYDPTLQLLHVDDAVKALCFAAERELAGVYNVASDGLLRWSQVPEALDRPAIPLPPVPLGPLGALVRSLGIPWIPDAVASRLRTGHAIDTTKLTAAGCSPTHDQLACLREVAGPRRPTQEER